MDMKQLTTKSDADLQKMLGELQESLREMRFGIAANKLNDVKSVGKARKTIARINTILRQRQLTA